MRYSVLKDGAYYGYCFVFWKETKYAKKLQFGPHLSLFLKTSKLPLDEAFHGLSPVDEELKRIAKDVNEEIGKKDSREISGR